MGTVPESITEGNKEDFDFDFYALKNNDVAKAFGVTKGATTAPILNDDLWEHFVNYGRFEGRVHRFDPITSSSSQNFSNKVIDADDNTISNLKHGDEVDNPSSGVHGVTGTIVGTSDTQTLTNKTLSAPALSGNWNWDSSGGYLQFTDITIPSNPSDGQGRLYKKAGNDGVFWRPDSGGAEVDLTSTSGGGAGLDTVLGIENRTLGNNIIISGSSDTLRFTRTNNLIINAATIATTNRTLTLPDPSGNDSVAYLALAQTLTNKTLTSPVLTTPQINDISADHQYIVGVNELSTDRTVTLPLLTGNDTFVFNAHTATLTNKTITGSTNTVSANNLKTTGSDVNVVSASPPTISQVLQATGATTATWQYRGWRQAVRVATTTNGTLATAYENGDTIDGIVLATGNRILIKNQSTTTENGIYTVNASGAPTRASDYASGSAVDSTFAFVQQGTTNADTLWSCTNNSGSAIVGTDGLSFSQLSNSVSNLSSVLAVGNTSNGNDIILSGAGDTLNFTRTNNLILDSATIATTDRTLTLPDPSGNDSVTYLALAQTLTNKTITASSNTVSTNNLKTTGSDVNVASASPPTTGQVLQATGATTSTWQYRGWRSPVRVATTTNGTLATAYENGDTIDQITLATGNRILLKDQTTESENGIYTVNASGAPTRASDYASGSSVGSTFVHVEEGNDNASSVWTCTNVSGSDVVGTNDLTYVATSPDTGFWQSNLFNTGSTNSVSAGDYLNNDSSNDDPISTGRDLRNVFWVSHDVLVERITLRKTVSSNDLDLRIEDDSGTEIVRFESNGSTINLVGSSLVDSAGPGAILTRRTDYFLKYHSGATSPDIRCTINGRWLPSGA